MGYLRSIIWPRYGRRKGRGDTGRAEIHYTFPMEQIITAALQAGRAIMDIYAQPEGDWEITHKADNSPLTLADRRSHEVIAAALAAHSSYPILSEEGQHLPYDERKDWHRLWVVDPLDGTKEFIKRNGEFTVNIALVEDGMPIWGVIYAPARNTIYWGGRDEAPVKATVNPETLALSDRQALPLPATGRPFRIVASRSHLSGETAAYIDRLRQAHGEVETVSAGSSLKLCLVAEGTADVYPRLAPTMEWDTAAGDAIARAAGCQVTDAATGNPLVYNKPDLHNPFFIVSRR